MISPETEIKKKDITNFLDVIKARSDYDFSNYSLKSLQKRLRKILSDNKFTMTELIIAIRNDRDFIENVVNSLTVISTELFRDPSVWRVIRNDILPRYLNQEVIRIWHPGCSTGQEVYSMMIILSEHGVLQKSEIYASDININALRQAKKGKYNYRSNHLYLENFDTIFNTEDTLTEKKIPHDKYFIIDKVNDYIQMKTFLTEKPHYKKIDMVKAENLFNIRFDLIICRNVFIYFNYDLQNKLFNLFYNNLNSNGCLVLGLHETIPDPYLSHFKKQDGFYYKRID